MKVPPEKRRDQDYLNDMIVHAETALRFTDGMLLADFEADQRTAMAATHCLQIVGEASVHLSNYVKSQIRSVPWAEIRGMRNILVHAYHNADDEIIFLAIKNRLPEMILAIKGYLLEEVNKVT